LSELLRRELEMSRRVSIEEKRECPQIKLEMPRRVPLRREGNLPTNRTGDAKKSAIEEGREAALKSN
jgi:hypothetical protein